MHKFLCRWVPLTLTWLEVRTLERYNDVFEVWQCALQLGCVACQTKHVTCGLPSAQLGQQLVVCCVSCDATSTYCIVLCDVQGYGNRLWWTQHIHIIVDTDTDWYWNICTKNWSKPINYFKTQVVPALMLIVALLHLCILFWCCY